MSGLLFLSSNDFFVDQGQKGKILCCKLKGFSLILFYSTQCQHCQTFIHKFKKLPGAVNGCNFAMINVSKNKDVVYMSKETIAPLQYVPYILLYVDGKPFVRYDGPHDENELAKFVYEIAQKVQENKKVTTHEKVKEVKNSIPEYCIAKPYSDEDLRYYLKFDEAYGDKIMK